MSNNANRRSFRKTEIQVLGSALGFCSSFSFFHASWTIYWCAPGCLPHSSQGKSGVSNLKNWYPVLPPMEGEDADLLHRLLGRYTNPLVQICAATISAVLCAKIFLSSYLYNLNKNGGESHEPPPTSINGIFINYVRKTK